MSKVQQPQQAKINQGTYQFLKPTNPFGFKRRFFVAGLANIFLTNLLLQLLLFSGLISIGGCTLISQLFNGIVGYMIYGKFVFASQALRTFSKPVRYLGLMTSLWLLNWTGIYVLQGLNVSKNAGGLLMIIPLAAYSYTLQRRWVFKK